MPTVQQSAGLCAQAGESVGVVEVDAGTSTTTRGTTTLTTAATTTTTAATLAATEASLARSTTATGTATTAPETTTLIATAVDVAELKSSLLLLGPFTGLLATLAHKVGLLVVGALNGLALRELLAGTLIGLTDLDAGIESSLLLQDLSKVVVVALDLLLLRGLSNLAVTLDSGGVLLLLGNGLTGLLVSELLVAILTAPALLDLLGVVGNASAAVTVITAGTLAATTTLLASQAVGVTVLAEAIVDRLAAVVGAAGVAVAESSLIARELLAATARGGRALSVLDRGLGGTIALAGAGERLVNGLGGRLRLPPFRVKLRVVAQELVEVLGCDAA